MRVRKAQLRDQEHGRGHVRLRHGQAKALENGKASTSYRRKRQGCNFTDLRAFRRAKITDQRAWSPLPCANANQKARRIRNRKILTELAKIVKRDVKNVSDRSWRYSRNWDWSN